MKSHPSRGCGAKLPRDPGASEGRGRIWGQPRYCSSHKKLLAVWHEGLGCPSAFPISVPSALLFQPILQAEALRRFLWSCCGSAGPCDRGGGSQVASVPLARRAAVRSSPAPGRKSSLCEAGALLLCPRRGRPELRGLLRISSFHFLPCIFLPVFWNR